jgi:hypothetical protein
VSVEQGVTHVAALFAAGSVAGRAA